MLPLPHHFGNVKSEVNTSYLNLSNSIITVTEVTNWSDIFFFYSGSFGREIQQRWRFDSWQAGVLPFTEAAIGQYLDRCPANRDRSTQYTDDTRFGCLILNIYRTTLCSASVWWISRQHLLRRGLILLYCILSTAAMLNIVQDSALLESIGAQTEVVRWIFFLFVFLFCTVIWWTFMALYTVFSGIIVNSRIIGNLYEIELCVLTTELCVPIILELII